METRKLIATIFLLFVMLFVFDGCGGGGGSGDSTQAPGDDSSLPPVIETASVSELLDSQNHIVEEYFRKYKQLLEDSANIDEGLFWVDSADVDAILVILDDSEKNYLLAQDILSLGQELDAIEQSLQENISLSVKSAKAQSIEIRPNGAFVLGACAIAGAAWGISFSKDTMQYYDEKKKCDDTYTKALYDNSDSGYTQEAVDSLNEISNNIYSSCLEIAKYDYLLDSFFSWGGSVVTTVGPGLATGRLKPLLEVESVLMDARTIEAVGTRATTNKITPRAANSQTDSFLATADETGTITVPEGDWDIVVYTPGYTRFGNRTGESISIREGETTTLNASVIPTSRTSASDIQSCEVGSDPLPVSCETPPSTTAGVVGAYYYVKGFYYPMPDSSRCYSAEQIAYYESSREHSVFGDPDRGSCTICPDGYALGDYEGVQTCLSCPDGKGISDGCCY